MRHLLKSWNVFSVVFFTVFSITLLTSCNKEIKKSIPLAVSYSWQREDNIFSSDRYFMEFTVYHKAEQPISGTYVIRAYGDVFGNGGEESSGADNFDSVVVSNASPGTGNGAKVRYYINNPKLQSNNLSVDQIKIETSMTLVVDFRPATSETNWRATTWVFRIEGGQFFDYGSLKEFQVNGGTLTSRGDR